MKERIKLAAVSYLNTKPLLFGILQSPLAERLDLQLHPPAVCARLLEEGRVDVSLVPVATLANLSAPRIISDFCIGAEGAVKTVGIFSDRPLPQVERLYLDPHSRTSVELVKVLLRDHWQCQPELVPAPEDFIDRIGGATAGLVIGDRSIGLESRFRFFYDLGEAWTAHTGLPFVFAVWVATRPLDASFLNTFNQAIARGMRQIPQLIFLLQAPQPGFDLQEYFTQHISYAFDEPKKKALRLFLTKIGKARTAHLVESLATG